MSVNVLILSVTTTNVHEWSSTKSVVFVKKQTLITVNVLHMFGLGQMSKSDNQSDTSQTVNEKINSILMQ